MLSVKDICSGKYFGSVAEAQTVKLIFNPSERFTAYNLEICCSRLKHKKVCFGLNQNVCYANSCQRKRHITF